MEDIPKDHRASISRNPPHWVPASEVRGEGIFIQFKEAVVEAWCQQVKELEKFIQRLFRDSERTRTEFFWNRLNANSPAEWEAACAPFRSNLWEEVLGRLASPALPANPPPYNPPR